MLFCTQDAPTEMIEESPDPVLADQEATGGGSMNIVLGAHNSMGNHTKTTYCFYNIQDLIKWDKQLKLKWKATELK